MNYPGEQIQLSNSVIDTSINTIDNIPRAFDSLPYRGAYILLQSHEILIENKSYNPPILKKRKRHFQGVVRTKNGKFVIFSGGDNSKGAKTAQLFICSCSTHLHKGSPSKAKGVIGSNLNHQPVDNGDQLEKIIKINSPGNNFWHCGGITVHDDILVVALEGDGSSSIVKFIDISDPLNPLDLGKRTNLNRKGTKAGTASLTRLPNNKYLCAVWVDSDSDKLRRFDFYLSRSTLLSEGWKDFVKVKHHKTINADKLRPKYQVIQLLLQTDGSIYIIGTENTNGTAPIPPNNGFNQAGLYKVEFPGNVFSEDFELAEPQIALIRHPEKKRFAKGGTKYNFRAAATPYITPEGNLALYATYHRNSKNGYAFQLSEFYPRFLEKKITKPSESLIELYSGKSFTNKCLRIRGSRLRRISDYSMIYGEGQAFRNKVSSIMYQLPLGVKYVLYDEPHYKGRKIELKGTGGVHTINDLDLAFNRIWKSPGSFNNKIKSSRFE